MLRTLNSYLSRINAKYVYIEYQVDILHSSLPIHAEMQKKHAYSWALVVNGDTRV